MHRLHPPDIVSTLAVALALCGILSGCRPIEIHDREYLSIESLPRHSGVSHRSLAAAMMPEAADLAGPHDVDDYVRFALAQNPQVQAKRKRVEAAAQKVPQAASLKDPTLAIMGYPFYPHVQQVAGGRMQVDVGISQEVPWFRKLDTQAEAAEAEADMARAELAAAELDVVEQVQRAYYELFYVQQAIRITEESRELAVTLSRIAEAKYRTAQVSQQDFLRAELEVGKTDAELVRLRQERQSTQARLARLLHVSPETPVETLPELPPGQIPQDLHRLYSQAIAARPELHAQLASIRRDRYAVDLACLQYYPDLTFSFGYGAMTTNKALAPTADGIDNISLGVMANIPIYQNRLRAGVYEAEATVVAGAREYDNLRDQTQEEIKDLFAQALSHQELLRLFDQEIIPKAEQTLQVSIAAYESNKVDFLQLIDNRQQLLQFQLLQQRADAQLRQALASLERVVGGTLPREPEVVPGFESSPEPRPVPPATDP